MRKELDDEVAVELPGGARKFVIVEITYDTLSPGAVVTKEPGRS
jgi:hypothetical protein